MRRLVPLFSILLTASPALGAPVLLEDTRELSVYAQAFDAKGEGDPVGPVILSRSAPGAFFAEQRAVSANAPGFGATAVAGAIQFTQFHDAPGLDFSGDGAAEVQVDLLDPLGGADAIAQTTVRLVFQLFEDTRYDLGGQLTLFSLGDVSSEARVSLRAATAAESVFERSTSGAFGSSGVLEEGVWVFELVATAQSAAVLPNPFESSNAVASFREVRFVLVPAPGAATAMVVIAALSARRRR